MMHGAKILKIRCKILFQRRHMSVSKLPWLWDWHFIAVIDSQCAHCRTEGKTPLTPLLTLVNIRNIFVGENTFNDVSGTLKDFEMKISHILSNYSIVSKYTRKKTEMISNFFLFCNLNHNTKYMEFRYCITYFFFECWDYTILLVRSHQNFWRSPIKLDLWEQVSTFASHGTHYKFESAFVGSTLYKNAQFLC